MAKIQETFPPVPEAAPAPGSQPLKKATHEKFAQLIAQGWNISGAYRNIHGLAPGEEPPEGMRIAANPFWGGKSIIRRLDVSARIKYLREQESPEFRYSREDLIRLMEDMLDLAPNDASLDNPLCDVRYVGKNALRVAATPERIRVAERLARLRGWDSETLELKPHRKVVQALTKFLGE